MSYRIVSYHGQNDDRAICKCGKKDADSRATEQISEHLKYERTAQFTCETCKKKKKK